MKKFTFSIGNEIIFVTTPRSKDISTDELIEKIVHRRWGKTYKFFRDVGINSSHNNPNLIYGQIGYKTVTGDQTTYCMNHPLYCIEITNKE